MRPREPSLPAVRRAAIAAACLCLPLAFLAGAARADIRVLDDLPPGQPPEATLRVREDAERPGHVLRIPRRLLETLAEGAPADGGSSAAPGRTRSIVAGIALSAAVAFGLVASRRRAARTAAAAIVCLAVAGACVAPALADLAVPGGRRPRPRPAEPAAPPRPIGAPGASIRVDDGITVTIEATDGDDVELVVSAPPR